MPFVSSAHPSDEHGHGHADSSILDETLHDVRVHSLHRVRQSSTPALRSVLSRPLSFVQRLRPAWLPLQPVPGRDRAHRCLLTDACTPYSIDRCAVLVSGS